MTITGGLDLIGPITEGRVLIKSSAMSASVRERFTSSVAAKRRDGPISEVTGLHSIRSSARESTVGGTVKPSSLAAVRLIANSNLLGK